MINWLKNLFKDNTPPTTPITEQPEEIPNPKDSKEPWVDIVSIDVDPTNMQVGAIELEWNQPFVNKLIHCGYRGKSDREIVDQWFSHMCRGIAMELWEQEEAIRNSSRYTTVTPIGNGRSEIS